MTLIVILSSSFRSLFRETLLGMTHAGPVVYYGLLFLFYVASCFVVIFFNTALISCVNAKPNGKDMSVGEGISNAANHLPAILGWAIVSATVGIVLHLLERRSGFLGQIVFSLLGGAWALVTYFVVPVLVLEDKGVFAALGESFCPDQEDLGREHCRVRRDGCRLCGHRCYCSTLCHRHHASLGMPQSSSLRLRSSSSLLSSSPSSTMRCRAIYVTALYTYAKTGTVPSAFHPEPDRECLCPKTGRAGQYLNFFPGWFIRWWVTCKKLSELF